MKHDIIEKNVLLMAVLIFIIISFGGLAQIVPLFFNQRVGPIGPWWPGARGTIRDGYAHRTARNNARLVRWF